MIAMTVPILIVGSLACLILNYFAFHSDAAAAGHGRKRMFQMAAIWITIIVGLTLLIGLFQS
jgi:hypothetical protein